MGSSLNPNAGGQVFAGPTYNGFASYDYACRTYTGAGSSPTIP